MGALELSQLLALLAADVARILVSEGQPEALHVVPDFDGPLIQGVKGYFLLLDGWDV